jgi:hypothetical protein
VGGIEGQRTDGIRLCSFVWVDGVESACGLEICVVNEYTHDEWNLTC